MIDSGIISQYKYEEMRVSKTSFYALIYSVIAFVLSLQLLPYYISGDQGHYREFYESCFYDGSRLEDELFCYSNTLGSTEPVYFFISKFVHPFLDKDIYISLVNAILVFLITVLTFKYYKQKLTRHIFLLFIFSNYYLVVLMLAAERLKFGFLVLTLALLLTGTKRLIGLGTSMLTHTQMALMIAPLYISKILKEDVKLWKKIAVAVICLVGFAGVFYLLREQITSKFEIYANNTEDSGTGITGALKTSIFVILSFISTRQFALIIAGMPLIALAYFLGADRIGMLAFILYAAAVVFYKGKADLFLYFVMLYFSYKSIHFILNVIKYGNGYVG